MLMMKPSCKRSDGVAMSNVVDKVLKLRDVCDVKTLRKTMMFDEGTTNGTSLWLAKILF